MQTYAHTGWDTAAAGAVRREVLLVELVGLPGAGKTTVARATAARLRAMGLRVAEDDLPPMDLGRRLARYARFAGYCLVHPRLVGAVARYTMASRPWSWSRLPFALEVLLHTFGAVECRRSGADVVLVSQGGLQAISSITVRGSHPARRHLARLVEVLIDGSERRLVAHVELDPLQTTTRLRARLHGGSRLDSMSPDETVAQLGALAHLFSALSGALQTRIGEMFRALDGRLPPGENAAFLADWVTEQLRRGPMDRARARERAIETAAAAGRIALFVPDLTLGGAERVMVNLAENFAKRGRPVDLVLVRHEGLYLRDVPKEVRIIDLACGRVLHALPSLVRYLRRERPAALLATLTYANVLAIVATRMAGAGTRIAVREANSLVRESAGATGFSARWLPTIAKWTYPWADAIVAVSHGAAQSLAEATGTPLARVHVLDNPVVNDTLLAQAAEPVDHPWFTTDNGAPVVVAAGRLTAQKDWPTLFRAFAAVRKTRDARLLVLGEGELREELETLARTLGIDQAVSLPGLTRNPFAYMSRAALFVLSSAWEGSPGVLIQAMACGAPVVSTDCESGPREILRGGEFGRLVPVGNVDALAKAIDEALAAPRTSPPRSAWARFSQDAAADAYLGVLASC